MPACPVSGRSLHLSYLSISECVRCVVSAESDVSADALGADRRQSLEALVFRRTGAVWPMQKAILTFCGVKRGQASNCRKTMVLQFRS
jgi:hypothetical protein